MSINTFDTKEMACLNRMMILYNIVNFICTEEITSYELRKCLEEMFTRFNTTTEYKLSNNVQEELIENMLIVNSVPKDVKLKAMSSIKSGISSFLQRIKIKEDKTDIDLN